MGYFNICLANFYRKLILYKPGNAAGGRQGWPWRGGGHGVPPAAPGYGLIAASPSIARTSAEWS
jgi:hypothetical protein